MPTDPGPDDDAFWPWLAGFIDGEGSVGWTVAGKYPQPYVSIVQHERYRSVLEEILSRCGGCIHAKKKEYEGFVGRGTLLTVRIGSRAGVRRVLENTLPHLRVKRQRALDTLAMLDESIRVHPRYGRRWTEIEDAYIKRHSYAKSWEEIGYGLRRTPQAVRRRAFLLWRGATERPERRCPLCDGPVTGNRLKIFCCRKHGREWEYALMMKRLAPDQLSRYEVAKRNVCVMPDAA